MPKIKRALVIGTTWAALIFAGWIAATKPAQPHESNGPVKIFRYWMPADEAAGICQALSGDRTAIACAIISPDKKTCTLRMPKNITEEIRNVVRSWGMPIGAIANPKAVREFINRHETRHCFGWSHRIGGR